MVFQIDFLRFIDYVKSIHDKKMGIFSSSIRSSLTKHDDRKMFAPNLLGNSFVI